MVIGGAGAGRDPLPANAYWGPVTATIDWCEQNYVWCDFIAEFWNTLTNLTMFFLGVYGIWHIHKLGNIERRYYVSFVGIMIVAFGSFAFHGTLRYDMQLLDELPMVYGIAMLIYCIMLDDPKDKYKNFLLYGLSLLCVGVTFYYVYVNKDPMVHEITFATMTLFFTVRCLMYAFKKREPVLFKVWLSAAFMFAFAFFLWHIDNQYCTEVRELREYVGPMFAPLLELHGWWHLLTGLSSYTEIVYAIVVRESILGRNATFGFHFGLIPYVKRISSSAGGVGKNKVSNGTVHTTAAANDKGAAEIMALLAEQPVHRKRL